MIPKLVGLEAARATLGRLVAEPGPVLITSRGRPVAALLAWEDYEAWQTATTAEARRDLAERLAVVRRQVVEAGLDPSVVDEAVTRARLDTP